MSAMPTDRLQRFIFDDTQVRGEIAQLFTVDPVAVDQDSHGTQRVLGVMIEKHLTHDLLHQ